MPSHSGTLLAVISPRPLWRLPPYPSLPPRRFGERNEWKRLTTLMAISRAFTGAQLKIIQEVITLVRAVFLIFKEWQEGGWLPSSPLCFRSAHDETVLARRAQPGERR